MFRRLAALLVWMAAVASAAAGEASRDVTHVLDVRAGWEYVPTTNPPSLDALPDAWQAARLPHHQGTEPCGVYRASFAVPAAWAGYRVSLVVRPSGGTVWVWLNGQLLGVRAPSTPLDVRLDAAKAVRPGASNALLIAIAAPGDPGQPGLTACWLEATGALTIERIAVSAWTLGQGGVADVALDAANHGRERFEGKVELAFEPDDPASNPHPVWRWGSDVRLDPNRSASVAHSFEPQPLRLWRFDDPWRYRLTATLQTRDGQPVRQTVRRVGICSTEAAGGRWLANRECLRVTAIAFAARGATLLCTQPGQASALAERTKGAAIVPLDELLDFCDGAGVVAFLDAPACPPDAPGGGETLAALADEATRHPCVWGWVAQGDFDTAPATLARLRELTPRLPVGLPAPDLATEAAGFDFLVAYLATKAGREDDDGYGRRLDDLVRIAEGEALIVLDRVTETADHGRLDGSLAHRGREAERRSAIAVLGFEVDRDDALFAVAEKRLSPFSLKEPHHEARMDRETFVLKSRFEVQLASPVAQRIACYSLAGHRIAWRASRGDAQVASGIVPLNAEQPRIVDGGTQPGRGEVEWRTDKPGDIEFVAELQSAAGRVLGRHRAKLSLKAKDGKAELSVQPMTRDQ